MKKLLLITFSFLLIGQLQAQNWRPFNPSDTVRHYLAEDSTTRHIVFYPILSTVVDSSYTKNGNSVYLFKKGFSYLEAVRIQAQNQFYAYQKIKGKILGDTSTFYPDSTIIKSIDNRGFTLNFPTQYYLGKSWQIANSNNQSIIANVDSIYYDSIPETAMDSMVSFQLQLLDSTGSLVSNSTFNQKVILSKHHGLVRTIDFTDLEETHAYQLYAWKTKDEKYYKQEEYFQLSPGDYYFSETHRDNADYQTHKYTVLSDSINTSSRYVNMLIESSSIRSYPLYAFPPPYQFQSASSRTATYQIKVDSNYRIKQSGVINDSNRIDPNFNPYSTPQFGLRSKWGEKWLVEFSDNNLEISKQQWWPFTLPDSIQILVFESSGSSFPLIGFGDEYYSFNTAFGLQYFTESIFFLKKGNQSWGTPPIIVGLNETSKSDSFKLFPNPTKGKLFFSTQVKFSLIRIYDQNGRLVKHWSTPKNEIDVSELPKGLYFINLQTQSGELINQKFVKQ